MKIRRLVLWSCAGLALFALLRIWFGQQPAGTVSPTLAETNIPLRSIARADARPIQRETDSLRSTNVPAGQTAPAGSAPVVPAQTTAEKMREGLAALNDVPIVFYGKLEDQFGNPVAGAQIAGNTLIYNGMRSGAEHVSVTSDANGFFQIHAGKGESLGIMPTKQGYALATAGTEFKYSYMYPEHFTPDPNKPVVMKMWKLQGAQPLVGINKEYRLPFTAAPLFFDLLTGKVSDSGGDLELIITRAPGSLSKRNPGDWSIEFKPANGGMVESDYHTSKLTFEAPAEGYQDSYLIQMKPENPAWFDNVHKVFFLKSRGGQVYSKLSFDFRINNEPNGLMWFQFRGAANANGSRNWEATADTTEPR